MKLQYYIKVQKYKLISRTQWRNYSWGKVCMWNESWPCDLLMDCLWKYFSQQVNLLLGTGVTWLWTRSWRLVSPIELIATLKCQATWEKQRVTEPQAHADIRKKTCLWNVLNKADCSPEPVENTLSQNSVLENQKAFAQSASGTLRYVTQTITLNTLHREGHHFQKTDFPYLLRMSGLSIS